MEIADLNAMNRVRDRVHEMALDKGWYGTGPRNVGEQLMLVTSELAEALEELRDGHEPTAIRYDPTTHKPEGFPIEIADAVIRLLDLAGSLEIDIGHAIAVKHSYNGGRPRKHGKKF